MHDEHHLPAEPGPPPAGTVPAARLPLAHAGIDRDDAGRRAPELLDRLLADPDTRILLQQRDTALIDDRAARGEALDGGATALDLRTLAHLPRCTGPLYLGRLAADRENPGGRVDPAGTAVVAVEVDDFEAGELEPDQQRWAQLGEVATELDDVDAGLFTQALALRNFHRSHRYSPATGEPLDPTEGGWVLRGRDTERPVFPRIDTAVIVLVFDGPDRVLLGANVNWRPRRFSLLAGFVEPGESFEQAAAREVLEEGGARIVDARYYGSQPWPFPASLMVGFTARLHPEQDPRSVEPDGDEIAEVRWFTRDELRAEPALLPGRASIARAMIDDWLDGRLGPGAR